MIQELSRPPRTASKPVNVLLADEHPALRAGVRSLIAEESGLTVSGEVASGEDACTEYRSGRHDVVVMDLSMTGFGGMEAIRRIMQFDAQAAILVYSVHATEVMLSRTLTLGALGYVTKASSTDVLIAGIRAVAARRGYVSPDLVPSIVRRHTTPGKSPVDRLTAREFQILLLTAQGNRADACALTLNLSEKTVRNHLTGIKVKLGVTDTAELIRLAIRLGLVEA